MITTAASILAAITDEPQTRGVGRPRTNFTCTAPDGCEGDAVKRQLCGVHLYRLVKKPQKEARLAARAALQR